MATYTKVYNNPYPDGWKDGKDGNTPVTASILNNQNDTFEAIEKYLEENPISEGGGSGGTTNYEQLTNKPKINGVELVGDLSSEDLGITGGGGSGTTNYEDLTNKPSINGTELSGDITLDIPTKTSDLTNDSGFLTEIPEQSYNDLADKPQINGIDLQGNLTVEKLGLLDITESTDTTLENSKDGVLKIKDIYGNTEQDGEPKPDTPIEIESVVLSEIKTCRKNLFNRNNPTLNALLDNGLIKENANGRIYAIPVIKGEKYTLSKSIIESEICILGFFNRIPQVGDTLTNRVNLANVKQHTFTATDNYMCLTFKVEFIADDVQVELGTTATEYEPYTESKATLSNPITLNGLNGVSDYVDVKRGVEHYNFKTVVFDGSESGWNRTPANGTTNSYAFYIPLTDYKYINSDTLNYMCTNLKAITHNERYKDNTFFIANNSWLVCCHRDIATLDDWKAHLASNPMTVVYELAEPIETPLADADVEALKSLKTYDGVTHILTDSEVEPDWFVEYNTTRVGTELDEIDAELAKINKRITDIGTTAQMNYSAEEQVVGTWIDGRPIYQKTLFYSDYALIAGYNELPLGINNIDVIIETKAYISNSSHSNYRPMNSYTLEDDNNSMYYIVNAESGILYLVTKTSWSTPNIHFTLQYTKTTDTV